MLKQGTIFEILARVTLAKNSKSLEELGEEFLGKREYFSLAKKAILCYFPLYLTGLELVI